MLKVITAWDALERHDIKIIFHESPNTAHEWQTWRRSLYHFAPLLFQNKTIEL